MRGQLILPTYTLSSSELIIKVQKLIFNTPINSGMLMITSKIHIGANI